MKDQLIAYVNLLFAGTQDCEEVREEILQNTLDRYDDLLAQGKAPEAAYRLAIGGIGDINEILGQEPQPIPATMPRQGDTSAKRLLRAIAIGLYIMCPLPLIALADSGLEIYGMCGLLCIVAVATVLIVLSGTGKKCAENKVPATPQQALFTSICQLVNVVTLAFYIALSCHTGAWGITWLVFPIAASAKALIRAILDLKECTKNEK